MAVITLGGNPIHTNADMPVIGEKAPDFFLVRTNMTEARLSDYAGVRLILNIFPSIDTGVCATSVRKFNELATSLYNVKVLCISRDLPFAQKRFCGAEGIANVETLSDFRNGSFGMQYGVMIEDGSFKGLLARAIVVLSEKGNVLYTELVPEIANEPNYEAALAMLR